MKKIGKFGILAIILLALFICLPQIAHFSTVNLWFSELGYQSVFIKFTFAKFIVGFVVFLLVFLLSYFTLQMTTKYQPEVRVENDTVINVPGKKSGKRMLTLLPSLLLGLLAGWLSATALWQNILLFYSKHRPMSPILYFIEISASIFSISHCLKPSTT